MEPADHFVAHFAGNTHFLIEIGRKIGVVAGGKGQLFLQAHPASGASQRPFGSDMDGIRLFPVQIVADIFGGKQAEADFRIKRIGQGETICRGDKINLVAELGAFLLQLGQGAHHAIDLGRGGVGNNQDFHQATRLSMSFSLFFCCFLFFVRFNRLLRSSAQLMISKVPSIFSTSAVQLSTQSPSFI